jgi:hypothetical protein
MIPKYIINNEGNRRWELFIYLCRPPLSWVRITINENNQYVTPNGLGKFRVVDKDKTTELGAQCRCAHVQNKAMLWNQCEVVFTCRSMRRLCISHSDQKLNLRCSGRYLRSTVGGICYLRLRVSWRHGRICDIASNMTITFVKFLIICHPDKDVKRRVWIFWKTRSHYRKFAFPTLWVFVTVVTRVNYYCAWQCKRRKDWEKGKWHLCCGHHVLYLRAEM